MYSNGILTLDAPLDARCVHTLTLFSEYNNSPQTIFQSTYMQIMLKKGTMEFFPKCFTEFAEF